jgi:hypothetical protein
MEIEENKGIVSFMKAEYKESKYFFLNKLIEQDLIFRTQA